MKPGTHDLITPLPWGVVALVALQVIGAIFFGSHILVHVFRHLFPGVSDEDSKGVADANSTEARLLPGRANPTGDGDQGNGDEPPETGGQRTAEEEREERKKYAGIAYSLCRELGVTPSLTKIATLFDISTRQAGYVRADVDREREEEAELETTAEQWKTTKLDPSKVTEPPSPNGSHPPIHGRATASA